MKGLKPFHVWNDNGKVMQSGWFILPDELHDFGPTINGNKQARAYIAGMKQLSLFAAGTYKMVVPESI